MCLARPQQNYSSWLVTKSKSDTYQRNGFPAQPPLTRNCCSKLTLTISPKMLKIPADSFWNIYSSKSHLNVLIPSTDSNGKDNSNKDRSSPTVYVIDHLPHGIEASRQTDITNICVRLPVTGTLYHVAGSAKANAWLDILLWLVFFPQDWLL